MSEGTNWRERSIRCPFFRNLADKQRTIACEGLVDDSWIKLSFGRRADYDRHLDEWCCKHYEFCEIAQIIEKCYED